MAQSMLFVKELADPEELHGHQAAGRLRVSVNLLPGSCYAGLGIAAHADPVVATRALALSAPAPCPPNCDLYELLGYLHKLSVGVPQAHIGFLAVTVLAGAQGSWARAVAEIAGGAHAGDFVAGAHLLGSGPLTGIVEVMSADHTRMLKTLLAARDIEGVVDARLLRAAPEETRGMGSVVEGA